jgi:hypothetical protein
VKNSVSLVAIFVAVVAMSTARGSTITYSTTINLNPADASSGQYLQSVSGATAFNVKAGDTITGTITFANGKLDLIGNVNYLDFAFLGNAATTYTSTTQLLGVTGSLGGPNPFSSGSLFGNSVISNFYGATAPNENFAITGIQYTINVSSVQANGGTVQTTTPFTPYALEVSATSVSVVPLPASAWLMLSGLGILAWLPRRRTSAAKSQMIAP